MASTTGEDAGSARDRRRTTNTIKESLRELSIQLSLLNHQICDHVAIKDVDLFCLDLLNRHGPMSPSVLARRAGLHPATMTGILDRLQRGGWAVRRRDPDAADRRAVTVYPLRDRVPELFELYSGMNTSMDGICADYTDGELQTLAVFLRRVTDAGQQATEQLAGD
ncbi:MarR family transcriptional regulator [Actinoallomurus sp. NPDC052308]|uniref:MarR family transcriptional regulator n=1 Tax=Actinoallomurus sp. NPDC052308 TaxID=3155530 RepID=UPI00343EFEBF